MIFSVRMKEIITSLSAAKALKKDGKGKSVYRCDKYVRSHAGCNSNSIKASSYESIAIKNKNRKMHLEKTDS